jgi:large subunit ribosomal protein L13
MSETYYFDATDLVLGRLSSSVVPLILGGKNVVIVNSEKAIVSGTPRTTIKKYLNLRAKHTMTNPKRGPFFPRNPDRIIRRTVRGMLPYKTPTAKDAFRRLSAFIGVPEELENIEFQTLNEAKFSYNCQYLTLEKLGRELGWRHGLDENY